ncbi:MAG: transglycosylase domain-containing protein [Gemmatimonadetes bacterium]|nr:transglycosylase domain-containing protein [Gemmatimonadota bacterium]
MWKRILIGVPLALLGLALAAYLILPWPILLRWDNPGRTAFMLYRVREARARGDTLTIQHQWAPLESISRHLTRAVIVAEDARFLEHHGVDWQALAHEVRYRGDDRFSWFDSADLKALGQALRYYWTHRDRVRGRSTISQQLAKNLYFTPERSVVRKIQEFFVAQRLEWLLGKDRILELYLNVAEWGPGVFGAEVAARHYFGRSAAELTAQQAAALAATLPHPLTSNPERRPARMAWRQRLILQRMYARGPVETVPLEPPAPLEAPEVEMPEIEITEPKAPALEVPLPLPDTLGEGAVRDSAPPPQPAQRVHR